MRKPIIHQSDLDWIEYRRTVSRLAGNKERAAMFDRIFRACGGVEIEVDIDFSQFATANIDPGMDFSEFNLNMEGLLS